MTLGTVPTMLVSQAHSMKQQARLAITLAWVAGYTNILTVLTCGTVTSHVSGTVSQWGRDWAEGRWSLGFFATFLLLMFFLGAMLSALCTETGRRRGWESIYVLPIAVQTALLAAFAVGVSMHNHLTVESGASLYLMVGLASLAMGLQNATITRISGGVVRTTHVTGVLTDLGLESVQFLFWLRDRNRNSPPAPPQALLRSLHAHPSTKRLAMLGSIVGSFALGSGLGALAFARFPHTAMWPPVVFLLWLIYRDMTTPICEIEASNLVGKENGVDLPDGIAVFHLRKDKTRRGNRHRLPDLMRWSERLPSQKRVVILDLDEGFQLSSNAALEFRALIRHSASQGRQMVISGLNDEQFQILCQAGAGDALDASIVCPDLELAIARGLTLLDAHAVPGAKA